MAFAAGAGRPVIRGMDANRVRVLEDGVGSFDVSDVGPDHGIPIDPFTAERVEVVRGAQSALFGTDAMSGVIQLVSARAARGAAPVVTGTFETGGYRTERGGLSFTSGGATTRRKVCNLLAPSNFAASSISA